MFVADKRIVVTGGSRGIGSEVGRALIEAGTNVASLDVLDGPGRPRGQRERDALTRWPDRSRAVGCGQD